MKEQILREKWKVKEYHSGDGITRLIIGEMHNREGDIIWPVLEATNKFLDLLGEFEDEVITLVEAIQAPVPGVPPYEAKAAPEEEGKEEAEGFGKRRRRR